MKKVFLPFLAATLLIATSAFAGPISQKKAQQIAANFFSAHSPAGAKSISGAGCQTISCASVSDDYTTDPAYYIFNSGSRYVIVSGDDKMPQLLGYSLEGSWPTDSSLIPTPLKNALQNYAAYVEAVREGKASPKESNGATAENVQVIVAPLLTTKWNQTFPYNQYAPNLPEFMMSKPFFCGHYPIGCVAIGMGQIINYWGQKTGKPVCPKVHDTYATWTNWYITDDYSDSRPDTIFYTFSSDTKYDWANIPDSIGHRCDTLNIMSQDEWDKKANAVATLLRDVAYSVNMSWARVQGHNGGGGAHSDYAPDALSKIFDFSLDSYSIHTSDTEKQGKYIDLIKADLNKGWPVLADGQDTKGAGGHCFVYDGYDSNNFVHVNWGWGGECNNFFDVDYLKTNLYDSNSDRDYNWSSDQDVILCIHPKDDGVIETPKPASKDVQLIQTTVSFENLKEIAAVLEMLNKKADFGTFKLPLVVYEDKDSNSLAFECDSKVCHKSAGYDYDVCCNLTNLDDGTFYSYTKRDSTAKENTITIDGSLKEYAPIDTKPLTDGLYSLSGAIREVLGDEASEWKEYPDNADTILVAGKDVVLNPSAYAQYYHGKDCIHYWSDKKSHLFFHMEFTKDPEDLHVGDTLFLSLEHIGMANKTLKIVPNADETIALTLHNDDYTMCDTIFDDTEKLRSFFNQALEGTYINDLIYAETNALVIKDEFAGKTLHLTYTIPILGVSMTNDIKVAAATGIIQVESESTTSSSGKCYNTAGQVVGNNFHGIIIRDGKKIIR